MSRIKRHYHLNNFDYFLPPELIAQKPKRPRDHSRLLVVQQKTDEIEHRHFYELPKYLHKGDVLVFNNSKVIPARLQGIKESGGKIEVFLLRKIKPLVWKCLFRGKVSRGLRINFRNDFQSQVVSKNKIQFNKEDILSIGETPVPPYIKEAPDLKEYQTVYARDKGSVAAPTAGFHFTQGLLESLKEQGIGLEFITLHVGWGTFAPVRVEDITKHKMHAEYVSVSKKTIQNIKKAKRIIAVGTTTVRTLEATELRPYQGWVDIFIYPGYKFKYVDAMITNFHLPKSSLIMLVCAFVGTDKIKKVYQEAIKKKYRFYSFGDAMFINSK